jgi:hypothetical protein
MANGRNKTGRKKVYPWDELEVGDCFIVEGIDSQKMSKNVSQRNVFHHQKYTRRVIDGKQWVWRVK